MYIYLWLQNSCPGCIQSFVSYLTTIKKQTLDERHLESSDYDVWTRPLTEHNCYSSRAHAKSSEADEGKLPEVRVHHKYRITNVLKCSDLLCVGKITEFNLDVFVSQTKMIIRSISTPYFSKFIPYEA